MCPLRVLKYLDLTEDSLDVEGTDMTTLKLWFWWHQIPSQLEQNKNYWYFVETEMR